MLSLTSPFIPLIWITKFEWGKIRIEYGGYGVEYEMIKLTQKFLKISGDNTSEWRNLI